MSIAITAANAATGQWLRPLAGLFENFILFLVVGFLIIQGVSVAAPRIPGLVQPAPDRLQAVCAHPPTRGRWQSYRTFVGRVQASPGIGRADADGLGIGRVYTSDRTLIVELSEDEILLVSDAPSADLGEVLTFCGSVKSQMFWRPEVGYEEGFGGGRRYGEVTETFRHVRWITGLPQETERISP